MSKYTTEVRYICETYAGYDESQGFNKVDEIIKVAAPKVFDFDFPIFDENYRLPLETKILRHYYTREISEETVGLWKLRLSDKMNMLMPYFNKLYESELFKFNPFYDVDYNREHEGEDHGESNSNTKVSDGFDNRTDNTHQTRTGNDTSNQKRTGTDTTTNNKTDNVNRWDLYSDTPQGGVQGILAAQDIAENAYLTNARHIIEDGSTEDTVNTTDYGSNVEDKTVYNSDVANTGTVKREYGSNTKGDTKIDNTDKYIDHVYGKMGTKTYAAMLKEFRETFLNIDEMLINELANLFFNLW